jgi:peptidoglycan/xylan/chitin deacetylase (PgdA/CDA1 family)
VTERRAALKIDVCTREGMRLRAPRLLDALKRARVRASFFLAFGPDCSGWAIKRLFDSRFRRKMARSKARSLYGWRTILSGTLLPARVTAAGFPDLVKRMADEGHEVALHGWNHRRWQDQVGTMDEARVAEAFARAAAAFEKILGRRPLASGAPGWVVSAASLRAQERLRLDYASDLRGGPPCRLRAAGEEFKTIQFATTTLCIEELLASDRGTHEALLDSLLGALAPDVAPPTGAVLPIHAEVEGGPYLELFERLLERAAAAGTAFVPLGDLVRALDPAQIPVRDLVDLDLAGRADPVASSAAAN